MKLTDFSQNLSTVNFSKFSRFLHFRQSKLDVTLSSFMKSSFSQNHIFSKK